MKNLLNQSVLFAGLVAAAIVTAGCQCSNLCCSTKPVAASTAAATAPTPLQTKESQAAMTPQQALVELREGNARFVSGQPRFRNLSVQVQATASAQYPLAVVLSCLDSRQPIEIVLDQGIGKIFSARIAGNVVNDDVLGSMEFACKASGAKLIAVIGHSNCGAIKGTVDDVQLGNLTSLLAKIKPAIEAVPADVQPRTSKNYKFVDDVAAANVRLVMQQIRERSPVLREMLDKGEIGMVGGMYDLKTGKIQFYDSAAK